MERAAIKNIGYENCTGCYGCLNICPIENAIEFKLSEDGFYKPFLTEKCINCGKCQEACPILKNSNKNLESNLEIYSCWSKDKNILKSSSSGGIFSELAKFILINNGIVYGAKWEKGEITHSAIHNISELEKLKKSKYLQSKIENSYREVKKYLEEGKVVLFVGTPCQIGALTSIVNNKNLITVDLICHGVPSYNIYNKYINENFEGNIKNIIIDFRNKDINWENFNVVYYEKEKILKSNFHKEDNFFRGFLADIFLNKACYNCRFRSIPRGADITLGDFWGVPKELKNLEGTSVVFLNNEKGKEIFEKIKNNIEYKKTELEVVYRANPCLYSNQSEGKREEFFREALHSTYKELQNKYFPIVPKPTKLQKLYKKIKRFFSKIL